jgi:ankyrin repeat protein
VSTTDFEERDARNKVWRQEFDRVARGPAKQRLEKIQELIAKAPSLKALHLPDEKGNTPLHKLSAKGRPEEIRMLLDAGAPINPKNREGRSPMHVLAERDHAEAIKLLIERGAPTEDTSGSKGLEPLVLALINGHTESVVALLKGNVNALDRNGETPLHLVASDGDPEFRSHNLKTAAALLTMGADVSARDWDGQTPLHSALGANNTAIADLLRAARADINAQDNKGRTPLHIVVLEALPKTVQSLLNAGADPSLIDKKGNRAVDLIQKLYGATSAERAALDKVFLDHVARREESSDQQTRNPRKM